MTGAAAGTQSAATELHAQISAEPGAVSRRRVVAYLAVSLVVLAPGALLRVLGPSEAAGPLGALTRRLAGGLDDIRFGSGLRFWLGVGGAAAMALLLLYPLRKLLARRFRLGSVGGWLHLHIVLGLLGPLAVLYHCNLGTGGFNANVALTMMLAVALSGIVGHLVHAPASAAFHEARAGVAAARVATVAALDRLDGMSLSKTTLITELEMFERELMAPRPGIAATLGGRFGLAGYRAEKIAEARWLVEQACEQGGGAAQVASAGQGVLAALEAYFTAVRSGLGRSLADQLWARWRLFHLPLFVAMIAATALHVAAVWDMDALRAANARQQTPVGEARAAESAPVVAPKGAPEAASGDGESGPRIVVPPVRIVRVTEKQLPPPKAPPVPAPTQKAAKPAPPPRPKATAAPPVVAPAPAAQPMPAPAAPKSAAEPLYAELKRLTDGPPMGLGAGNDNAASLADRLRELKAQRFDHARTKFPLTGKHVRVACESCHTKSLEATPRDRIACHREDDIHRGRRADCARCHTTNRWSEIVRRR